MGEILNFEKAKRKIRNNTRELRYKKALLYLSLYMKREQMTLIKNDTNEYIDFLLKNMNKEKPDDKGLISINIDIQNISKIKYDYIYDVDILIHENNMQHISMGIIKEFFGPKFKTYLVCKEELMYSEICDSEYVDFAYSLSIKGPKIEFDRIYDNRFGKGAKMVK